MILRTGIFVLLAAALIYPDAAAAQWWITKEYCEVTSPEIDPEAIDAAYLAQLEADALKIENSTGRLWRITSAEGAVSHLWGTFHSNDPIILDLPDEFRRILRTARFVALEFDPTQRTRRQIERMNQGEGFYRSVRSPSAYEGLDLRVLEWLGSRLISMGYGVDAIPFLTAAGLADVALGNPCNDFSFGILPIQDGRVQLLGSDAGAVILGLEATDAFTQTMNRVDRQETALAIIEAKGAYLNPEITNAHRRSSFALYLQGRIGEMMAWERDYYEEFFGLKKAHDLLALVDGYLVHERNLGFLETAIPLLTEGGAVIAVGNFHLPGEKGLVNLFREAGFRVERVMIEGEIRRN